MYRSGFASSQEAYEEAVIPLFDSLDRIEKILTGRDYLAGDQLTEADVRLFVTIVSERLVYMWAELIIYWTCRSDLTSHTTVLSNVTFVLSVTDTRLLTCASLVSLHLNIGVMSLD